MKTIRKISAIVLVLAMLASFATLFASAETANVLSFNAGNAEATVLPDTVESDEVIKVTLLPAAADGRTFSSWADDKGNTYKAGQEITVAGKVTLTAIWDADEKQPNTFWQLILRIIDFFRTLFENI